MVRNRDEAVVVKIFDIFNPAIKGNRRATSMSKIKKMIVSKKNRIEKGSRPVSAWSNPHSKAVAFSRDVVGFDDKTIAASITRVTNKMAVIRLTAR